MADPRGFLKIRRQEAFGRPAGAGLGDFREVMLAGSLRHLQEQALRCMDCGTPFCHWGCPIGNYISEWNDLIARGHAKKAFLLLEATNNLPEITGRVCPAACEYACVLGINDEPVTIRENELAIAESAFKNGFVKPRPPPRRTGKRVAIIGSGPAGLSCAAELNKAGNSVIVFEKDSKPGGILRYGIPDFKLEKWVIDRRIEIYQAEGIEFATGVNAGTDYPAPKLCKEFDAVVLATGCGVPRDLKIEGRDLPGIHFAMDYLVQANKRAAGDKIPAAELIDARDKAIVIIGGGDTGADCAGTAQRQGACRVTQIEILPKPPECRSEDYPWPSYPIVLKESASGKEGIERQWAIMTKKFLGDERGVRGLCCAKVELKTNRLRPCPDIKEVPKSAFEIKADLVILAAGFTHPQHSGLLKALGIELDKRGNVKTGANYMTSAKGIFSAGDMRIGQSLVVRAISEGRRAAWHVDKYLIGDTQLSYL